jgi:hypothetical protein
MCGGRYRQCQPGLNMTFSSVSTARDEWVRPDPDRCTSTVRPVRRTRIPVRPWFARVSHRLEAGAALEEFAPGFHLNVNRHRRRGRQRPWLGGHFPINVD